MGRDAAIFTCLRAAAPNTSLSWEKEIDSYSYRTNALNNPTLFGCRKQGVSGMGEGKKKHYLNVSKYDLAVVYFG